MRVWHFGVLHPRNGQFMCGAREAPVAAAPLLQTTTGRHVALRRLLLQQLLVGGGAGGGLFPCWTESEKAENNS